MGIHRGKCLCTHVRVCIPGLLGKGGNPLTDQRKFGSARLLIGRHSDKLIAPCTDLSAENRCGIGDNDILLGCNGLFPPVLPAVDIPVKNLTGCPMRVRCADIKRLPRAVDQRKSARQKLGCKLVIGLPCDDKNILGNQMVVFLGKAFQMTGVTPLERT